jgi:heme/copper-type cytochrome/quinol oxidase subunit 2
MHLFGIVCASKQTSKQANKQTSKQANKQTSKQANSYQQYNNTTTAVLCFVWFCFVFLYLCAYRKKKEEKKTEV